MKETKTKQKEQTNDRQGVVFCNLGFHIKKKKRPIREEKMSRFRKENPIGRQKLYRRENFEDYMIGGGCARAGGSFILERALYLILLLILLLLVFFYLYFGCIYSHACKFLQQANSYICFDLNLTEGILLCLPNPFYFPLFLFFLKNKRWENGMNLKEEISKGKKEQAQVKVR